MVDWSFRKVRRTASALSLAAILASIAGASSAQEIKIVPFLTAESSPESVQAILELIAEFEADNPDIGIELQLTSNDNRGIRIINSVSVGDELGIFEIERRLRQRFQVPIQLRNPDGSTTGGAIDQHSRARSGNPQKLFALVAAKFDRHEVPA